VLSTLKLCVIAILMTAFAGCATSSGVLVNPSVTKANYQSAFVVVHGGSGIDMDALMQKELLRHGLSVTAGAEAGGPGDAQLLVRYADDWKWDLKMYLWSLDVMVFDPKTKVLLATGSWKNSAMHGFYSEGKVVAQVIDQTLNKIASQ
jgi:hypothetical protein